MSQFSTLVSTPKRRAVFIQKRSQYAKYLKITTLNGLTHAQTCAEHYQLSCGTGCCEWDLLPPGCSKGCSNCSLGSTFSLFLLARPCVGGCTAACLMYCIMSTYCQHSVDWFEALRGMLRVSRLTKWGARSFVATSGWLDQPNCFEINHFEIC